MIIEKPMTSNLSRSIKNSKDLAVKNQLFIFGGDYKSVFISVSLILKDHLHDLGDIKISIPANFCQYSSRYDEFHERAYFTCI